MRPSRLFVLSVGLVGLSLWTGPAAAASIVTFSPLMWKGRASGRLSTLLNRKDCIDDVVATTSISVTPAIQSGATLALWSGAGCDQYANRSPTAVSKTCTRVTQGDLTPISQQLTIHFRDLIKAYTDDSEATEAVCDLSQSPGLLTRTLYFVISDPNTNMSLAATSPTWAFKYDIQGPPPPSNVSATSGDRSLVTAFTAVSGQTNLLNYHFYCSPIGTNPAATGGTTGTDTGGTGATDTGGTSGTDTGGTGATDTGGTDAGGASDVGTGGTSGTSGTSGSAGTSDTPVTVDPSCQSSILVPGKDAPSDAIDCGHIAAQGATGGPTSEVLTNGDSYAVAVATEDNANNIGVLSGLACGSPRDIRGFFEAYREAGGKAGGGYCSFAPATSGSAASALGLLLGACALGWRRRR